MAPRRTSSTPSGENSFDREDNNPLNTESIVVKDENVTTYFSANRNNLTDEIVKKIIAKMAMSKGVPYQAMHNSVLMLMLMGAGSSGSPDSLKITTSYETETNGKAMEGTFTTTKGELLNAYNSETKNKYLRRMAEFLANESSSFAEKNNLIGDLANQLNIYRLAEGHPPLTPKQKAWASSFNQNNPKLESDAELLDVAKLLAKDFMTKFRNPNKSNNKKAAKRASPKRQGQPKTKAQIKNNKKKSS